ncbi:hypothetical protein MYAM1_000488 [Malassezia yamatoensis]|uniref:C2H2-type domain-containing protein n=1 Tax=Malassezia yamatoensis TaxID=253288 RepID=A0AAJ6CFI1_9BASI|nr:hypothetical protein MYAM1_000488 [Malassezia yamatoensis]
MASEDVLRRARSELMAHPIAPLPQPPEEPKGNGANQNLPMPVMPGSDYAQSPNVSSRGSVLRDAYQGMQDNMVNGMLPIGVPELENNARVLDPSMNPSMNLLLSLTLRLVPNARNGELSNEYDFTQSPAMDPSNNAPKLYPSQPPILNSQLRPSMPQDTSVPPLHATKNLAQSGNATDLPPNIPPDCNIPDTIPGSVSSNLSSSDMSSTLDNLSNVGSAQNIHPVQDFQTQNQAPSVPRQLNPLNHTAQLNSLASAASETDTNEYAKIPMYSEEHAAHMPAAAMPAFLPGPQTLTPEYLSVMRQSGWGANTLNDHPTSSCELTAMASAKHMLGASSDSSMELMLGNPPPSQNLLSAPLGVLPSPSIDASTSTFPFPSSIPSLQRSATMKLERSMTTPDFSMQRSVSTSDTDKAKSAYNVVNGAMRSTNSSGLSGQFGAAQEDRKAALTPSRDNRFAVKKRNSEPTGGNENKRLKDNPQNPAELSQQFFSGTSTLVTSPVGMHISAPIPALDSQGQKRFQCPKCSRAFARAYNLNTHLSTHDPDPSRSKPFLCPYKSCKSEGGRAFSRKHDLQRHVASVHEWEPEPGLSESTGEVTQGAESGGLASLGLGAPGKKFRCERCARAFVRRDALRRHHCNRKSSSAQATPPSPGLPYFSRSISSGMDMQSTITTRGEVESNSGEKISLTPPEIRHGSAIRVAR